MSLSRRFAGLIAYRRSIWNVSTSIAPRDDANVAGITDPFLQRGVQLPPHFFRVRVAPRARPNLFNTV